MNTRSFPVAHNGATWPLAHVHGNVWSDRVGRKFLVNPKDGRAYQMKVQVKAVTEDGQMVVFKKQGGFADGRAQPFGGNFDAHHRDVIETAKAETFEESGGHVRLTDVGVDSMVLRDGYCVVTVSAFAEVSPQLATRRSVALRDTAETAGVALLRPKESLAATLNQAGLSPPPRDSYSLDTLQAEYELAKSL